MFNTNQFLFAIVMIFNLSFSFSSIGQETKDAKSDQYGIKAGINFAELLGEDAIPESDRKVGYSFGVYATYKLNTTLKIQPEIIWSLQGEKSEDKGRYDISYLNIPVVLKWTEGKWYAEFGPQLGLLTVNTSKSIPDELRLTEFETFDFSVLAGVGFQIDEEFAIGVRYVQGLTNIVQDRDLRNSVIYFGLSYRIF